MIYKIRTIAIGVAAVILLIAGYQKSGITGVAEVLNRLLFPPQAGLNIQNIDKGLLSIDFSTPTDLPADTTTTGDCQP